MDFVRRNFADEYLSIASDFELKIESIGPSGEIAGESSVEAEVGTSYEVDFVIRWPSDGRTRTFHGCARL